MLSYQHIYHAGNQPDIHKHAALAVILTRMMAKDNPFTYMETHAGRGLYDLSSKEAAKTGEFKTGIEAFLREHKIPPNHPYARAVAKVKEKYGAQSYPGSPAIAQELLRFHDRMHLMELHPQEHAALSACMNAPNIKIHKRDGYEGALALSPPVPRRGVLLIDPSYEVKTEYAQAAEFVVAILKKWPEVTILLWYPVLTAGLHSVLVDALVQANLPGFWQQEILFTEESGLRLRGSGLIGVNLPFGAEPGLEEVRGWFV